MKLTSKALSALFLLAFVTTASAQFNPGVPNSGASGGGGGGGGGAATIANGADVAEGSTTDAPASVPASTASATTIALLKALVNVGAGPTPAGTALIGGFDLRQLNSVALGSPSSYGTSPGAVSVAGVNAFVTNTVNVASHAVTNAGTFAVQNTAATPAGTNLIGGVNNAQVAGVAVATGNGVSGTGVQRVAIASDNTPFSVVPVAGAPVSCSLTTATAATAQNAFTGLSNVRNVTIMDIDTGKTEGIWISWLGTAAPNTVDSFYVPPYSAASGAGSFSSPPGIAISSLSVYAATAGHKVSCSRS